MPSPTSGLWHRMMTLPYLSIPKTAGAAVPETVVGRPTLMATGAGLFLMLVFSTLTVFVRGAWPVQCFQAGVFALVGAYLLARIRKEREPVARGWIPWLVYLIPVWGALQIWAHTTVSTFETRQAVLKWSACAGVFFLSQVVGSSARERGLFQSAFLGFAAVMAVLCMTQFLVSDGRLFWIVSAGNSSSYETFSSYNDYAQFAELALPIALWRAVRTGAGSWWYALVGGVLYASVIGSASRAGALLCTAELLTMLAIGVARFRSRNAGTLLHSKKAMLIMVTVLVACFTLSVGWQHVWHRFHSNNLYSVRREFLESTLMMAEQRPLTGFGLGTFPQVYPRYAVIDLSLFINHAHNDWAEFAADGGFPFLLLVLIPFAFALPAIFRNPWALGIVAVMLHACVDFPLARIDILGWTFAMLGLVYMVPRALTAASGTREDD